MKILKPAPGQPGVLQLAAEMLCMEHGARAFGAELEPLPPPHDPWPVVVIPPVTSGGSARTVHYRPTVGVVYYTEPAGFCLDPLVAGVAAALEAAGDAHLRGHRAVAATPSTVIRHSGRVSGGTAVEKGSKPEKRRGLLARLLVVKDPLHLAPPPHYSDRAGFTWVFMPAAAAIAVTGRTFDAVAPVNAMVASVLYDAAHICRCPPGAEVFRVAAEDFGVPPTPASLGGPCLPSAPAPLPEFGAFTVDAAGAPAYVGDYRALHCRPKGRARYEDLPPDAWENQGRPAAFCLGFGNRRLRCLNCDILPGGAMVVARVEAPAGGPAKRRAPAGHGTWQERHYWLMCAPCWGVLSVSTLRAPGRPVVNFFRTAAPFTVAEAYRVHLTDYGTITGRSGPQLVAEILGGSGLRPVPGAPGAYEIRLEANPDTPGAILAGPDLGGAPALTCPGLVGSALPVLPSVRVARLG